MRKNANTEAETYSRTVLVSVSFTYNIWSQVGDRAVTSVGQQGLERTEGSGPLHYEGSAR